MKVAFFQRIFAHYQAGLVRELYSSPEHEYLFFGDDQDPMGSGIEPIPLALRDQIKFTVCKTLHWGRYLAVQWQAVNEAIFGNYDVYIFEGSFTILTNWLAIMAARLRGKRILLYSHGWLHHESGCKAWVRRCFYRSSHGLLLYGKRSRQIGIELGFSPDRLYVAYNSLDLTIIDYYRNSISADCCNKFRKHWFGSCAKNPFVVSVGRITTAKEYPLLIEAVALLHGKGVNVNLMIVGEGPEYAGIKIKANDMKVPLILSGACYDEKFLSVCITAADVTVIPGAAGLAVIHSLSYGTPVVVHSDADSQGPESEAIQDGINGAFFRAGDAKDLSAAILRVIRNLPRSAEVAEQCRAIIDTAYSPIMMREVFDNAVAGRPANAFPNKY